MRFLKDLLRYSYSYDWLAYRVQLLRHQWGLRDVEIDEATTEASRRTLMYDEHARGWIECQRAIGVIADRARGRGAEVMFLVFANNVQLSASAEDDIWYPVLQRILLALDENGVHHRLVIDDVFRAHAGREQELWVRPDDSHFSVLAHELTAGALYESLTAEP